MGFVFKGDVVIRLDPKLSDQIDKLLALLTPINVAALAAADKALQPQTAALDTTIANNA